MSLVLEVRNLPQPLSSFSSAHHPRDLGAGYGQVVGVRNTYGSSWRRLYRQPERSRRNR